MFSQVCLSFCSGEGWGVQDPSPSCRALLSVQGSTLWLPYPLLLTSGGYWRSMYSRFEREVCILLKWFIYYWLTFLITAHTSDHCRLFQSFLPPATKLGQGYVFTCVCDSVHSGGCYPSMHCRWYPSMPCSRSGGCYPSMHCKWYPNMLCSRTPGGGSAPGGCLVETPLGQLLLQVVRILLECILVNNRCLVNDLFSKCRSKIWSWGGGAASEAKSCPCSRVSHASEASYVWPESKVCLRVLEAFGF